MFIIIILFTYCLTGDMQMLVGRDESNDSSMIFCNPIRFYSIFSQVSEHEKGLVGTFTGFFLNMGLVFGATFALGVEQWVLQK